MNMDETFKSLPTIESCHDDIQHKCMRQAHISIYYVGYWLFEVTAIRLYNMRNKLLK